MKQEKNMLLLTSFWQGALTFKMMPTSLDCPYAEVIYVPQSKGLAIISKIEYEKFSMVPKLDAKGNRILISGGKKDKPEFQEERKLFRTLYEYQIIGREEVVNFIKAFASNEADYDYVKFVDAEETYDTNKAALTKEGTLTKVKDGEETK